MESACFNAWPEGTGKRRCQTCRYIELILGPLQVLGPRAHHTVWEREIDPGWSRERGREGGEGGMLVEVGVGWREGRAGQEEKGKVEMGER